MYLSCDCFNASAVVGLCDGREDEKREEKNDVEGEVDAEEAEDEAVEGPGGDNTVRGRSVIETHVWRASR